jgi:hypothetical protein
MAEQAKPAGMRRSGHYGYCFGTKRPWVQIPPPRQQNTSSEAVCDRVVMASGDQLRDYRILFQVGASLPLRSSLRFTVVIACRSRLRNRDQADDHGAKPATPIHPASSRNQQVRALNINERRGETTTLSRRIPPSRVAMPL